MPVFEADSLRKFHERVAEIQRRVVQARSDPSRWPYRGAAAVLSRFRPPDLQPVAGTDYGQKGWSDFLSDCEPATDALSDGWWQLRDEVRRDALRRLGSRPRMQEALSANPLQPDDELQRALTATINNTLSVSLTTMSRKELAAVATVSDWLGGILEGLPSNSDLRRALAIADMLAPLQRLAGGGRFIGRRNELQTLRDYIGVQVVASSVASRIWHFVRETYYDLKKNPPLLITGPGGIGKSALVARLILDHSERFEAQDALPFVYLDLDRAALDPTRPLSLVAEAALQLMIEWPHLERPLHDIVERVTPLLSTDGSIFEDVRGVSSADQVISEFGTLMSEGGGERPVLLVVDTFEEAQYLGFDVVQGLGALLTTLQVAAPMLRIVLAGRADLSDQTSVLPTRNLTLGDLEMDEARELLRRQITTRPAPDSTLIDEVIGLVGRNPLSLKLAATVVNQQGERELETVGARDWLLLRVKSETVQARLYGRILAHIHDEDVRRLVKPGLLVRRLTADVIREVLAIPCGISMPDPSVANELMIRLANEVALFSYDHDGSLRHRPDVRRLMLKDLVNDIPAATIREIHDRAVAYYEKQQPPEPISRAEEIYHRLTRGDDPQSIESRWIAGMENYLRNALEELPAPAQIWLSKHLGVTPDRALLTRAELEDWETITALSVRRLIATGDAAAALKALGTRSDRTDTSPLFLLESEAYRLLGNWQKATEAAECGQTASARAGEATLQRDLLVQLSLIEETSGHPEAGLARIDQALAVPGAILEPLEKLRLTITRIRLLRRLGSTRDEERRDAIDQAVELLTPTIRDRMNQQPALLREAVAELGQLRPDLLSLALEIIGLQFPGKANAEKLAHALREWDTKLSEASGGAPSELAQRASLHDNPDPDKWLKYVNETGHDLSTNIMNWRAEMQPDRGVDKAVVDLYRSDVDAALQLNADVKTA